MKRIDHFRRRVGHAVLERFQLAPNIGERRAQLVRDVVDHIAPDLFSARKTIGHRVKGVGQRSDLIQGTPDEYDHELPGHFWIEVEGRCYDAEAPEGVEDWKDLPIFQRARKS